MAGGEQFRIGADLVGEGAEDAQDFLLFFLLGGGHLAREAYGGFRFDENDAAGAGGTQGLSAHLPARGGRYGQHPAVVDHRFADLVQQAFGSAASHFHLEKLVDRAADGPDAHPDAFQLRGSLVAYASFRVDGARYRSGNPFGAIDVAQFLPDEGEVVPVLVQVVDQIVYLARDVGQPQQGRFGQDGVFHGQQPEVFVGRFEGQIGKAPSAFEGTEVFVGLFQFAVQRPVVVVRADAKRQGRTLCGAAPLGDGCFDLFQFQVFDRAAVYHRVGSAGRNYSCSLGLL